jgi:hypothetical protein
LAFESPPEVHLGATRRQGAHKKCPLRLENDSVKNRLPSATGIGPASSINLHHFGFRRQVRSTRVIVRIYSSRALGRRGAGQHNDAEINLPAETLA